MDSRILNGKKHIHFIGIGGSGMYPLAQILHSKGYYLTGSDNNETETLKAVREMGIPVTLGQAAENIEGADLIVHTAAIMADNPELIAAKASGVPVLERSELLGLVTSWYDNAVCVSGTHGKTTTSSMLTQILLEAGVDASAVIGGKLPLIGGSGRVGSTDTMVCEACEFVDTFLKLYPDISVILNIDADHLDYFKTVDNIIKSFAKFAHNTTKTIIVNGDDDNSMKAVEEELEDKKIITFGFGKDNEYYPENIRQISGFNTEFSLMRNGEKLSDISIFVPGIHNVLNAVAACAAAIECGVEPKDLAAGLKNFRGAGRRFELLAEINGITVADDYAHHPAELTVTLNAAKSMNFKRVWAVFQPFTFSRTKLLLNEFAASLKIADKVVMTEIMGSREKNVDGIHTSDLAKEIPGSVWFDSFDRVAQYVVDNVQSGDLVITLGCGDVYKVAKIIIEKLKH
ncbi:MAG: UDP-N-acetylmuramate--L-alanine ligase [Oscillospiraceae bacterium]